MYVTGRGIEKEGVKWIRKAAEHGFERDAFADVESMIFRTSTRFMINGADLQDNDMRYMQDLMDGERPTAEEWYRDNPEHAPVGFRADIERVVSET